MWLITVYFLPNQLSKYEVSKLIGDLQSAVASVIGSPHDSQNYDVILPPDLLADQAKRNHLIIKVEKIYGEPERDEILLELVRKLTDCGREIARWLNNVRLSTNSSFKSVKVTVTMVGTTKYVYIEKLIE